MNVNWWKVTVYAVIVGVALLWSVRVRDTRPTHPVKAPVVVVEKPLPPAVTHEKPRPAPKSAPKADPTPKSVPAPKHHVKTCKDVPAQAYKVPVDTAVEYATRQGLNNYTVEKLRNCLNRPR